MHDVEREIATGGPHAALWGQFALKWSASSTASHIREVALRRDILGCLGARGRHPVLGRGAGCGPGGSAGRPASRAPYRLTDDMAMLALTMDLAEALSPPMSVIWSAIRNWIDQGLV